MGRQAGEGAGAARAAPGRRPPPMKPPWGSQTLSLALLRGAVLPSSRAARTHRHQPNSSRSTAMRAPPLAVPCRSSSTTPRCRSSRESGGDTWKRATPAVSYTSKRSDGKKHVTDGMAKPSTLSPMSLEMPPLLAASLRITASLARSASAPPRDIGSWDVGGWSASGRHDSMGARCGRSEQCAKRRVWQLQYEFRNKKLRQALRCSPPRAHDVSAVVGAQLVHGVLLRHSATLVERGRGDLRAERVAKVALARRAAARFDLVG